MLNTTALTKPKIISNTLKRNFTSDIHLISDYMNQTRTSSNKE